MRQAVHTQVVGCRQTIAARIRRLIVEENPMALADDIQKYSSQIGTEESCSEHDSTRNHLLTPAQNAAFGNPKLKTQTARAQPQCKRSIASEN